MSTWLPLLCRRSNNIWTAFTPSQVLSSQPAALQLRYLQTLTEISSEKNTNTIVFPLPLDLIKPIYDRLKKSDSSDTD